jgi:hypothetical protein
MENFARCYVDPVIEFVTFHLVFIAVVPSKLPFVLFTVYALVSRARLSYNQFDLLVDCIT